MIHRGMNRMNYKVNDLRWINNLLTRVRDTECCSARASFPLINISKRETFLKAGKRERERERERWGQE